VADALRQPREIVVATRTQLADASLLDATGSPTPSGQALSAGIDFTAVQTTIDTLDTMRVRAEQLFAS
jgi:hypothetical protein